MNTGIDNKQFKMKIYEYPLEGIPETYCIGIDPYSGDSKDTLTNLEVIKRPKRLWYYNILYYLSLGFIDKRGWKYKVKII